LDDLNPLAIAALTGSWEEGGDVLARFQAQIVNAWRMAGIELIVQYSAVPRSSHLSVCREYPVRDSGTVTKKELMALDKLTWKEKLTVCRDIPHCTNVKDQYDPEQRPERK
jgi:hypothetical protein